MHSVGQIQSATDDITRCPSSLAQERALRVKLCDALDAVLIPSKVLSAPVNRLLVMIDLAPRRRRRVIPSDGVRQARGGIVRARRMEEGSLVSEPKHRV